MKEFKDLTHGRDSTRLISRSSRKIIKKYRLIYYFTRERNIYDIVDNVIDNVILCPITISVNRLVYFVCRVILLHTFARTVILTEEETLRDKCKCARARILYSSRFRKSSSKRSCMLQSFHNESPGKVRPCRRIIQKPH